MSSISYLSKARRETATPDPNGLSTYCRGLFSVLPRSDQRRWGEVYLRGLLDAPGRKTPTCISEHVLGRPAVQQLQQFIGQSPWECGPVRRYVAGRFSELRMPEAWSVDEAVIAKNGDRSVGVARQFAPSRQRTVNCQVAVAVSLVGGGVSLPVSWRLMLPQRWDSDERLRRQAHVPEQERSRPRWQYVLEALDEMLDEWELDPAPVLADWRHDTDPEPLLLGLEARGLGYLIDVSDRLGVTLPGRRHGTLGELARYAARGGERTPLAWQDAATGRMRRSQFLTVPVHLGAGPGSPGPSAERFRSQQRHLVVDWPFGRPAPRSYHLTNLSPRRLGETASLIRLRGLSRDSLGGMQELYGLGDFEGRSFRGWHHHATLVTAAFGFRTLRALRTLPADIEDVEEAMDVMYGGA
ncbi:IS701 family transposase [Streptomyces sp. NBC_00344]|uniref:IS701 family transposase n=1 Tax=Streptomyces sp. NBC_00344 TaxID=2975720 RepID=UPI002E1B4FD3